MTAFTCVSPYSVRVQAEKSMNTCGIDQHWRFEIKKLGIAIVTVLAGAGALTATTASAQGWGYDSYVANRAYHSSDVRAMQARRDQHAANVAAYYGDYGAANAYAHAADMRSAQAWHDARMARHAEAAARWDYRYGW
jgi:hypothetical protein